MASEERVAIIDDPSALKNLTVAANHDMKAFVSEPCSKFMSPPNFESDTLGTALHVIDTEQSALVNLHHIYKTDHSTRRSMADAVGIIAGAVKQGGRLIVTGVGKSGRIGEKCVATMNSLGVRSAFLHPTEALHGDMGMIGPADAILIITFSGKTPELLSLIPHLPQHLPHLVVSAHMDSEGCPLISKNKSRTWILLPAPIPIPEIQSFGIAAPTTSTTVALALADALAFAVAKAMHVDPEAIFRLNHPGGALGGKI